MLTLLLLILSIGRCEEKVQVVQTPAGIIVQTVAPTPVPSTQPKTDQEELEDLQKAKENYQKSIEAINTSNPLSDSAGNQP
jgi:hypothetical protein